jgi:hypothetical protein
MARWNITTILHLPFLVLLLSFGNGMLSSSTSEERSRSVLIDGHGVATATEEVALSALNSIDAADNMTAMHSTLPPIVQEETEEVLPSPNSLLFTAPPDATDEEILLGVDLGVKQSLDAERTEDIYQRIREARVYMHEVVGTEPKYEKVRETCRNAHTDCTYWAVLGECDNNPGTYLCGLESNVYTCRAHIVCMVLQDT